MVSLGPAPSGWEDAILSAARQFMTGRVCFYATSGEDDDYSEIGIPGTGANIDILWTGKARIQHLRAPRNDSSEYQASDSRSFRFQLDPADNPPQLYSGAKARVVDGGRDSSLETYSFIVDSAVNSSQMAVRTIELTSDMRPIDWTWTVNG